MPLLGVPGAIGKQWNMQKVESPRVSALNSKNLDKL